MGARSLDVAVVGAGFAGLYALYRFRELGYDTRAFEAAKGAGGTWYWNRYPGARCDVESVQYSYSFSPELEREWQWSERYASQPEILAYLEHVAERFDLNKDIQFETRIERAVFDETVSRWTLTTDGGETISAKYCVMATGCLSVPNVPPLEGQESFLGDIYLTGRWPHERVDFTGHRVAVIGTGSSGIQAIPLIAEEAEHVFVFQRTANFSVPAQNRPLAAETAADWKAHSAEYRDQAKQNHFAFYLNAGPPSSALEATPAERREAFETGWERGGFNLLASYADLLLNHDANATACEFVRDKIRGIIDDPDVAKKLLPYGYPIGAKRLCLDTNYYATYNRDNVTLIDLRATPIARITPDTVETTYAEYPVDSIVLATGFDAVTGALCNIDIRGRGNMSLKDKWAEGPRAYLGLMVAGFPNLFTITGPGSPSVLSNMVVSIEQHVDWIADCVEHLRRQETASIEATPQAEDAWVAHVNEVAAGTVYPDAASWYTGANIEGKARIFMPYIGGFPAYAAKCNEVAASNYAGFALGS